MLSNKHLAHYAIRKMHFAIFIYFISALLVAKYSTADIVKPAMVEISVFADGNYRIELRASIEAIMTGINSKYRNTQDAPSAGEYDALRVLQSAQLREKFIPFENQLEEEIKLYFDKKPTKLQISEVIIPVPG
ncbi:MAG: hypothetical protein OQK98_11655, partial [Gammaproteobacteria bacterium]|nr:hypothetical protein [Gammaproteobacteria bacterium]